MPEVVSCGTFRALGEILDEQGPFDVLVSGPGSGDRGGLMRLAVVHDELPSMSLVIAFAQRPEVHVRDIVRVGALDVMPYPVADEELACALERAVYVGRKLGAVTPDAVPGPALVASGGAASLTGRPPPGRVFTVSSATGGCGKTFYVTNLAWFLGHQTGHRVCIIDLDLQFGEASTALRLRPRYSIFDALERGGTDESHLAEHIEEYLVVHHTGIHVLAAPNDPSEADRISPTDVTGIIEVLRRRFEYVIVDTPAALTETVIAALDLSDVLFVMATLDLPSIRTLGVFLNTLDKLKIPTDDINLVLNKAERDVGIDVDRVLQLFPQGFKAVLPYAREVSKSINLGTPVIASAPGVEISRRMAAAMSELLPPEIRPDREYMATGRARPRLFRRHLRTGRGGEPAAAGERLLNLAAP